MPDTTVPQGQIDKSAMFRIGYGLYVITTRDDKKDTGCVVNSVAQVADNPLRLSVCINKANHTHEAVMKTKILNVNCLSIDAPFALFRQYGFQSGRDTDKFADISTSAPRSSNGLICLPQYINAAISLKVEKTLDLGSHTMFLCEVTEAKAVSALDTMTYSYYQTNVKPKSQKPQEKKSGFVCRVCGHVYEGEELPDDYICPICHHGADSFEKL